MVVLTLLEVDDTLSLNSLTILLENHELIGNLLPS